MKLRGGAISNGLRWCKEQDDILRKANRQLRTMNSVYFWIGVLTVLSIEAASIHSSYYKLYMEFTGAVNYTGQDVEMVGVKRYSVTCPQLKYQITSIYYIYSLYIE